MNETHVCLEAQYPIWAGAGSLYGIQALSPVSDEDTVSYVVSKGVVVETTPREVGNGLPDPQSQMGLGGERAW